MAPIPSWDNIGWSNYLDDETTSFTDLPLTWSLNTTVPDWIKGSYIKNGPARKTFDNEEYYSNYLDSWGKLHKFTFDGANVTFSGRMIETKNYYRSFKHEQMTTSITLGPVKPKDWGLLDMMTVVLHGYDNTNVMLWRLGSEDNGQYIATTDYPLVHEVDMDTLAVKQQLTLSAIKDGVSLASCSHWLREVGKDTSLNFHVMLGMDGTQVFKLYRFGNNWDEREVVGSFKMPHGSMIHMFTRTSKYAVIVLYPVTVDIANMFTNNMHPLSSMKQLKEEPTKIYLINLRDGSVIDGFTSTDPSLTWGTHFVNAWEESGHVIFDLSTNKWDALASFMDLENMLTHKDTLADTADFLVKRVSLNLKNKEVTVAEWPNKRNIPLLNTVDFGVINERFNGIKNCFAFGWVSMDYWRNVLVKKDLCDSNNDKTWSRPSHYPGEMWFLPRPDGTEEDDGVVITVVFDGVAKQSYLLLLDGKTFEEMNYSYLPHNIPFSFHGNWFPELH